MTGETLEIPPWSWDPDRLALVLETAAGFFESHLADRHREHLRTRYGLTDETIARGRIGFAPVDRSTLIDRFNTAGLTREEVHARVYPAVMRIVEQFGAAGPQYFVDPERRGTPPPLALSDRVPSALVGA